MLSLGGHMSSAIMLESAEQSGTNAEHQIALEPTDSKDCEEIRPFQSPACTRCRGQKVR
jgi:hypothetical protein